MQIKKFDSKAKEYEELKKCWCEVFGDDPDYVDELYYALGATGYALSDNDELHSFLTLFEAGEFEGTPVMVSYGICTWPQSRGKAYASTLVQHVRDEAIAQSAITLISPAEPSLVEFYSGLGYQPSFLAENHEVDAAVLEDISTNVRVLSAAEYNNKREEFLAGIPHVIFSDEFMNFVRNDSVNAQGTLLINNGDAICTINYGSDDEMGISELIVNPVLASLNSEIAEQIAASIAALFEVDKCYYRTPATGNMSYVQSMTAGRSISSDLPYYGFPLD